MKPLEVGGGRSPERPPRAGARSDSLPDFLRRFEPFQGFADRKISPPPHSPGRRGGRDVAESFRFSETVDAVASASSESGRIWRDSNSVSFIFNGLQGGKFCSLPAGAASPTLGPRRRAREAEHSGDRARPCDVRPRARSRSRGLATCDRGPRAFAPRSRRLRDMRRREFRGSMTGADFVIGGRTKRITRPPDFQKRKSCDEATQGPRGGPWVAAPAMPGELASLFLGLALRKIFSRECVRPFIPESNYLTPRLSRNSHNSWG